MYYNVHYDIIRELWIVNANGIIRLFSKELKPEAFLWLAQRIIDEVEEVENDMDL